MEPEIKDDRLGIEMKTKTRMEFAVEMKTPCCIKKVQNVMKDISGVRILDLDLATQRLVVEGSIVAESVKDAIEQKTGMSTIVLGQGSEQNLGAGVAAIQFGNFGVLGLMRLVQNNQNTCIIEGTVDRLPFNKPLFLSIHESGNVAGGCDSCGSLLKLEQEFDGILGTLTANDDRRAEFRLSTCNVKLSDMIGRCVVVHEGDREQVMQGKSNRLACGIVARASGLFQNSKRFCACDGVTIWEQKNAERSGKS